MKVLLVGFGYIGAYLAESLFKSGHELSICSSSGSDFEMATQRYDRRYQELDRESIREADAILWFAGHSSVKKSVEDPTGAIANNCSDLIEFVKYKRPETRLIYASTGSLYSYRYDRSENNPPLMLSEQETRLTCFNPYDQTKAAFDALANLVGSNLVGLRLGTISGFSPRLRPELVFNGMNVAALREGVVRVSNADAWRCITFLDDLAQAIDVLLDAPGTLPDIVNIGSMNIRIGELARRIADYHGVRIEQYPDSPGFSFCMDRRLSEELGVRYNDRSIEDRCLDFKSNYLGHSIQ